MVKAMPNFTNAHNLSAPLFEALTFDTYSKGKADISVTELLKSPRQRLLAKRHDKEITVDASENLWLLMGRAVHNVLRESAKRVEKKFDGMAEERLFTTVHGPLGPWTLSGEFDLLYNKDGVLTLTDFKVLSVFSYIFEKENSGVKSDHETQVNIYRWLLAAHGFDVQALEIAMIFRDWKRTEAEKAVLSGKTDYPGSPVLQVPVKIWPLTEVEHFVLNRIALHQKAEPLEDDALPECTSDERWATSDQWAVYSGTNKRAFRVFTNEQEAGACAEEISKKVRAHIEFRKGKSRKCTYYCVAKLHCQQFKKELENADTREAAAI